MRIAAIVYNIIVFLYYFVLKKNKFHPLVFFSALWFTLTLFSSLQLYDLFAVSEQMWAYIFMGEVSFTIPFLYPTVVYSVTESTKRGICTSYINYQILDITIGILVVFSLFEISTALRQYASGMDMGQVRAAYYGYGENASNTALTTVLHTYITEPLRVLLRPLILVDFVLLSKNKIRFSFELFIIASSIIISGGRFELAYFLIQYIFVYYCYVYRRREIISTVEKRKKYRKISFFSIIVLLLIYLIGKARGSIDLYRTIYLSLAEPLVNCDIRIEHLQSIGAPYFYGLVSLRGILNPLFFTLKQLHIFGYPQLYLIAGDYMNTQNYIAVGNNLRTNAYVTPLYDFYLDAGIIGIIVGMFLFGVFAKKAYYYFSKYNLNNTDIVDVRSATIYLIFVNSIIQMLHTLAWVDTSFTFSILFCLIITERVYRKND